MADQMSCKFISPETSSLPFLTFSFLTTIQELSWSSVFLLAVHTKKKRGVGIKAYDALSAFERCHAFHFTQFFYLTILLNYLLV